jgi:hypothetical protein
MAPITMISTARAILFVFVFVPLRLRLRLRVKSPSFLSVLADAALRSFVCRAFLEVKNGFCLVTSMRFESSFKGLFRWTASGVF